MVKMDPINSKAAFENQLESMKPMPPQQETISLVSRPMSLQVRAGLVIGTCIAAHLLNRFPRTFRGPIPGASEYGRRGRQTRLTSRTLENTRRQAPVPTDAASSSQGNHDAQTSLVLVTTNREGAPAASGAPLRGLLSDVSFDSR